MLGAPVAVWEAAFCNARGRRANVRPPSAVRDDWPARPLDCSDRRQGPEVRIPNLRVPFLVRLENPSGDIEAGIRGVLRFAIREPLRSSRATRSVRGLVGTRVMPRQPHQNRSTPAGAHELLEVGFQRGPIHLLNVVPGVGDTLIGACPKRWEEVVEKSLPLFCARQRTEAVPSLRAEADCNQDDRARNASDSGCNATPRAQQERKIDHWLLVRPVERGGRAGRGEPAS